MFGMKDFAIGVIFGIIICTVGISGITKIVDNGIDKLQSVAKEASK